MYYFLCAAPAERVRHWNDAAPSISSQFSDKNGSAQDGGAAVLQGGLWNPYWGEKIAC